MEENYSKIVDGLHRLRPGIDKLTLIGELANNVSDGQFIPASRFTKGLCQICLEVILAFEKVYKYVGDISYTLRCYEASYDAACAHEDENPLICQGWARAYDSATYIHAWVEIGDDVFDWTKSRAALVKEDYYLKQGIEGEPIKYSLLEFCKLRIESGTFGPWHETLT